jgi:hypothetical protein
MKKIVWTFGLIAGAILSIMMVATIPFMDRIGFEKGELIGYSSMVAAFLLVFFGVRQYRDYQAGGSISFGRAFWVGILITAVASTCYTLTWQVVSRTIATDFGEKYAAYVLEKERAKGATPQQIEAKRVQVQKYKEMAKNPIVNAAITFLEPLPVALVMSLVSAGLLRRRRNGGRAAAYQPATASSSGSSAS